MNKVFGALVLIFGLGFAMGCATSEEEPTATGMKEEIKGTTEKKTQTWSERRDEFLSQSHERVKSISSRVEELEKSKTKLSPANKDKARTAMVETKELLEEVREDLGELDNVDSGDWQEERLELLSKMNQLEERFATAKSLYE